MAKQKVGVKAITSIPGWAEAMMSGGMNQPDKIATSVAAYAYVPLLGRAVRFRCNSLIKPRLVIMSGKNEVDWPFECSARDLFWKTEASLLLTGGAWIEKQVRQQSRQAVDLKWVNPTSMEVRLVNGNEHYIQRNTGQHWQEDEMLYLREFALSTDIQPGDYAAKAALNDSGLMRYMSRFASHFFETGAMPATIVHIDGLLQSEEERTEKRFRKWLTGVRNAFRLLVLNRSFDFKVLQQPISTLAMDKLYEQAMTNISWAFDINKALLTDAANRATATEYRLGFYQDTVEPRALWLAEQFNKSIFEPLGMELRFAFEELDLYQEDEEQRAQSVNTLTSAITTDPAAALWSMLLLGYDLTEEQKAMFEELFLKEPEPPPPPVPPPPPPQPVDEDEEDEEDEPEDNKLFIDLDRWMRKAINRLKRGQPAACEFESGFIPEATQAQIMRGLAACKSHVEVQRVFAPLMVPQAAASSSPEIEALLQAIKTEVENAPAASVQPVNFDLTVNTPKQSYELNMTPQVQAVMPEGAVVVKALTTTPITNKIELISPIPEVTIENVIEAPQVTVENKQEVPQVNVENHIEVQPADVIINAPKRANLKDPNGRIIRRLESE